MKKSLRQTLSSHNARVLYRKTPMKCYLGGVLTGFIIGQLAFALFMTNYLIK